MCMRISLATVLLFASPTTVFAFAIYPRSLDAARSLLDKREGTLSSAAPSVLSARALSSSSYLPAQIGGLVGAYGLSLVIVAALIILLSKRRREHLDTGEDFDYIQQTIINPIPQTLQLQDSVVPYAAKTPLQTDFAVAQNAYVQPSFLSTLRGQPGVDPFVDPEVVSADREMAQTQLEEMYKYVMEQEAAKAAGIVLEDPPPPLSPVSKSGRNNVAILDGSSSTSSNSSSAGSVVADHKHRKGLSSVSSSTLLRKEKNKPHSLTLNLGGGGKDEQRKESRTSSILSALKSPRKKKMQGLSISSPIMTPMSGTFPRGLDGEEMSAIPPRHYAPAAPPPLPMSRTEGGGGGGGGRPSTAAPPTPDMSPLSTQSIDQRIGTTIVTTNLHSLHGLHNLHTRQPSTATLGFTERDPDSAISQDSSAPLVGLPTSPKPGVNRFPSLPSLPSLPSSPRASGFSRPNAPSAVRTGGALPLRAYEPSLTSPSFSSHSQTKQTVFERTMPQSPGGAQTPWTGAPVPYSPYQPFSPVVPMTPSLVTKADRKRMKRLEPKTPTMEMVRSIDDTW